MTEPTRLRHETPTAGAPAAYRGTADRRFTADAEAHERDAPRFCPRCAASMALASEFWEGDDRRFYCACTGCGWSGEITPTGSGVVGHEPEH